MPGVILSQLEMHTIASAQLRVDHVLDAVGNQLARRQRIQHAAWPIAMPSSTAMVLNSLATRPPFQSRAPPRWPMSSGAHARHKLGNELAIAMMGLSKSPSCMPGRATGRERRPCCGREWWCVSDKRAWCNS